MPARRQSLSLNVLQIQSPCDAGWDTMTGTATKRHCARCNENVHDFASISRRKAEQLFALSQTRRVCVRITRDAGGRVITRNRWRSAYRHLAAAAGFLLFVVGLPGCGDRPDESAIPERTVLGTPVPIPGMPSVMSAVDLPASLDTQPMSEEVAPSAEPILGRIAAPGEE